MPTTGTPILWHNARLHSLSGRSMMATSYCLGVHIYLRLHPQTASFENTPMISTGQFTNPERSCDTASSFSSRALQTILREATHWSKQIHKATNSLGFMACFQLKEPSNCDTPLISLVTKSTIPAELS